MPGELVAIESKSYPHLNGSVVTIVRMTEDGMPSYWGYICAPDLSDDDRPWDESALRKLPPETPATFDAAIWAPSGVSA